MYIRQTAEPARYISNDVHCLYILSAIDLYIILNDMPKCSTWMFCYCFHPSVLAAILHYCNYCSTPLLFVFLQQYFRLYNIATILFIALNCIPGYQHLHGLGCLPSMSLLVTSFSRSSNLDLYYAELTRNTAGCWRDIADWTGNQR